MEYVTHVHSTYCVLNNFYFDKLMGNQFYELNKKRFLIFFIFFIETYLIIIEIT